MAISSSTIRYRHDVFLSYSNETHNNFTDHVHEALIKERIRTYWYEGVDTLKVFLEKTIRGSRGSVIVLSKNYAQSKLRLDDLVEILEARRNGNHFVVPVFYKVDRSDVLRSFKSLVADVAVWGEDKVKGWEKALMEVADLPGIDVLWYDSQAGIVSEIVKEVLLKLHRVPTAQRNCILPVSNTMIGDGRNDVVYIVLKRCECSLHDLILPPQTNTRHVPVTKDAFKDFKLKKLNGYPSPGLLKVMRDTVATLVDLHELGIILRDLNPQNVLIRKYTTNSIIANVSDMGISKHLPADTSFIAMAATACRTPGWQAPETLCREEHTTATDMFNFGCLLCFSINGGRHPYGDMSVREKNILANHKNLSGVVDIPEAFHLISGLLHPNPMSRPTAAQVLHHPTFWDAETCLSFLAVASDRAEREYGKAGSDLLKALENTATIVFGTEWYSKLDDNLKTEIEYDSYRTYNYNSVCDLLRVIRNKRNHYGTLDTIVQGALGSVPEGFESYFRIRFPKLLIEVYKVVTIHCGGEELFDRYFGRA